MGRVTHFWRAHTGVYLFQSFTVAAVFAAAALLPAQNAQSGAGQVVTMLGEHQYQQALSRLDGLLAQNPHDCRLLPLRGLALNGLHRSTDAEQAFQDALRDCPDNLLALEGAAQIEYSRKQPGTADLLLRILAIRPDNVTAHAMLASFYRGNQRCKAALPHFEASSALFASRPQLKSGYAFCLAKTGQYAKAAAAYQSVLDTTPGAMARYNLTLVQWRMGDAKSALETLRPLLTSDAQEPVLALGSRVAEDAGDTPLAVKLLRSAIVASPKSLNNYLEFARISFNHHSFQVGIDMIHAGLTQLPNAAPLYLARGILEVQLSRSEQAVADFEKAHKLQPQLSLATDAMGIMESQQFKQKSAMALFREQSRLHPDDSLLQYLYAEALSQNTFDPDSAREAILAAQRSVAADPAYGPARDLLALLWLHASQPQKALEQAVAARKIRPDDDVALYHEIMARRALGQTAQVKALVGKLTAMRAENERKKRADRRYVLQEEPGS